MFIIMDDRAVAANPEYKRVLGLILAINHYISTGDYLGEAVTGEGDDAWCVMIPVNQTLAEDCDNFRRLQARMEELSGQGEWKLRHERRRMHFEVWVLEVTRRDLEPLIRALWAKPGPLGWGTCKAVVDQLKSHRPDAA
ncbi:MAG: hypothetical protein AMXMBFR53_09570 [Gemmatimonadota bacterium]